MTGFVLQDAQRDRVVFAPTATWDRKLHQVLFQRPKLGTLRLENAVLDVERRPDGTIDLYDTIKPILGLDPKTALRIEAPDGRLRLRGKGLPNRSSPGALAIALEFTPVPGPVGWSVKLANGPAEFPTNRLDIDGSLHRGSSDVEIRVSARQWPLAIGDRKLAVSGKLDGTIQARKTDGRWQSTGDTTLGQIEAAGRWLAGEELRVEQAQGVWDLAESEAGWSVRRFELTSPLATLKGNGNTWLDGRVDLAAVAAQLPAHAPAPRGGRPRSRHGRDPGRIVESRGHTATGAHRESLRPSRQRPRPAVHAPRPGYADSPAETAGGRNRGRAVHGRDPLSERGSERRPRAV